MLSSVDKFRELVKTCIKKIPALDVWLQLTRRKLLASGDGYPNWKAIVSKEFKPTYTSIDNPQRVLMATSIGSHLAAMQMETTLAAALSLRGLALSAILIACFKLLPIDV